MKVKKLILLSIVSIIVITSFTGCFIPKIWWAPILQNQTGTWMSEDGKIIISNIGIPSADITIQLENEHIEGIFYVQGSPLDIFYKDEIEANERGECPFPEPFEIWEDSIVKDDSFHMTVQKTTYFEVGQKIYFHKVAE